ncbi:MAG: sigma-70 family RNA polymerase sigma factor [Nanoarchaeota archaeon]
MTKTQKENRGLNRHQRTIPKENEAELIRKNEPLIEYVIRKHFRTLMAYHDDLMQEGRIGLLYAIRTHDPKKGNLATHAVYQIRGRIDAFLIQNEIIYKPSLKIESNGKILWQQTKVFRNNLSIDNTLPGDDSLTFKDILPNQNDFKKHNQIKAKLDIEKYLNILSPKEKFVLEALFCNVTLDALAKKMNYSKEFIRLIKVRALNKIKIHINKANFDYLTKTRDYGILSSGPYYKSL